MIYCSVTTLTWSVVDVFKTVPRRDNRFLWYVHRKTLENYYYYIISIPQNEFQTCRFNNGSYTSYCPDVQCFLVPCLMRGFERNVIDGFPTPPFGNRWGVWVYRNRTSCPFFLHCNTLHRRHLVSAIQIRPNSSYCSRIMCFHIVVHTIYIYRYI